MRPGRSYLAGRVDRSTLVANPWPHPAVHLASNQSDPKRSGLPGRGGWREQGFAVRSDRA